MFLQVSSGALDEATSNLEHRLRLCGKPLTSSGAGDASVDDELRQTQTKSLSDVIHELVRQVTSPNALVREQVTCSRFFTCVTFFGDIAHFANYILVSNRRIVDCHTVMSRRSRTCYLCVASRP